MEIGLLSAFFLQVSVLYALQVFCHSQNFPKGTVKVIYTEQLKSYFDLNSRKITAICVLVFLLGLDQRDRKTFGCARSIVIG